MINNQKNIKRHMPLVPVKMIFIITPNLRIKTFKLTFSLLLTVFISGCEVSETEGAIIQIENNLNFDRKLETLELDISSFHTLHSKKVNFYQVIDSDTGRKIITQMVDTDFDGKDNILLFQPEVEAKSKKEYRILTKNVVKKDTLPPICYSRFVPERLDDYAWENNRVAFRVYGPSAQALIEKGFPGGMLSSGVDAWLKRVEYPIINRWYEAAILGEGNYHVDTGEGLDNFNVGNSRGIGGTAVEIDSIYHTSKNFTGWRTITTGPLRTSFVLQYDNWNVLNKKIREQKKVSLDYGSNFSKFEVTIFGSNTIATGLAIDEGQGTIVSKPEKGWISYWKPHDDSELGTAIIVPDLSFIKHDKHPLKNVNRSNLYVHIKTKNSNAVFFTGFGWKKSGQFSTKKDWEDYIERFVKKINNPLKITVLKKI